MAEWGVFYRTLEIFPHENADSLEIARAGNYQFVVKKGQYKNGDGAFVIPEKSVLTGALQEKYKDYLAGSDGNRVKSVRLRGELSMGILMSPREMFDMFAPDASGMVVQSEVNYAERFGVTKYTPKIPTELSGEVDVLPDGFFSKHDVEHLSVYRDALLEDDMVVITEKIHGTQAVYTLTGEGEFFVTSKGLFNEGFKILESETNAYWRAARAVGMEDRLRLLQKEFEGTTVQAFGEVIPVQGGAWTYGRESLDVLLFDVRVAGRSYEFDGSIPAYFMELWVPILYIGRFGDAQLSTLRSGNEMVSGRELHIREGIVVRPLVMGFAADGTRLFLKVINPAYKETGEEFN